ncbi:basic salivary proline-rich protein 2-like [Penaeus monodon]|uniref:basic salivary proline-rich protein 2-like n=1 Tax=Penaeus monodon TaxID=6687 RepID=UPI0018A7C019|nr:basic salivary proline-rich protein 2-like [Penaeus monodon]
METSYRAAAAQCSVEDDPRLPPVPVDAQDPTATRHVRGGRPEEAQAQPPDLQGQLGDGQEAQGGRPGTKPSPPRAQGGCRTGTEPSPPGTQGGCQSGTEPSPPGAQEDRQSGDRNPRPQVPKGAVSQRQNPRPQVPKGATDQGQNLSPRYPRGGPQSGTETLAPRCPRGPPVRDRNPRPQVTKGAVSQGQKPLPQVPKGADTTQEDHSRPPFPSERRDPSSYFCDARRREEEAEEKEKEENRRESRVPAGAVDLDHDTNTTLSIFLSRTVSNEFRIPSTYEVVDQKKRKRSHQTSKGS